MTTIHQALGQAMREIGAVGKDSVNAQQGFKFRGVDAVINAVAPAFRNNEIIGPVPDVLDVTYEAVEVGAKRSLMESCRVTVRFALYGPEGDSLTGTVIASSFDSGDKAAPKAMSVALRIFLLQTLCLPTDDRDPDADAWSRTSPEQARQARIDAHVEPIRTVQGYLTAQVDALAARAGLDTETLTEKFRQAQGASTLEDALTGLPAETWATFLVSAEDHIKNTQVSRALAEPEYA